MMKIVAEGGRRWARTGVVPPAACTIPLDALLAGRHGRWRPHPALWRWLERDHARRTAPVAVAVSTLPAEDKLVRLVQPAPATPAPSSPTPSPPGFDKRRGGSGEAAALREALSKPRRLSRIGDVDARIAALYARFPWFGEALAAMRLDLIGRAARRGEAFALSPVVLAGPPGCGKSRFVRAFAEAFGSPWRRVDRAGESDAREFLGTGVGWAGETAAMPTRVLAEIDVANPVIFVDELDKETHDARGGSLTRGLLAMLEPETASTWRDPLLTTTVDLSHIVWIIAVNDATRLPAPLRSRVAIHQIAPPGPAQFDALLDSMLLDQATTTAIDDPEPLDPAIRDALRARFSAGGVDARQLRRLVEAALAAGRDALRRGGMQ